MLKVLVKVGQKFAFFIALGSDLSGESHKFETILI